MNTDVKKGKAPRESKRQLVLHKLEAKAQATTHVPESESFIESR
jgi:hypothetical protein